jgi:predicted RNA binding protein YcfA (HicA-like mRNA interferase family)
MTESWVMKAKQFLRKLQAAGVTVTASRGKGGHVYLVYGNRWSTLGFHGSDDIGPNFLREICKQLGIDWRNVL